MTAPVHRGCAGLRALGPFILASVLGAAVPAAAADTAVRVGDHAGFGRVVFDLPVDARYETVRAGDRLLLVFQGAGQIETPARTPRNVAGFEAGSNSMTVVLAPGAEYRAVRMRDRLVLDVLDRRSGQQRASASRPARPEPAADAKQAGTVRTEERSNPAAASQGPEPGTKPGNDVPPAPVPVQAEQSAMKPRPAEPRKAEPQPASPPPRINVPTAPEPVVAALPAAEPRPPAIQDRAAAPAPAVPAAPAVAPAPTVPERAAAPEPAKPDSAEPSVAVAALPAAILLPADAATGAAAFRRGDLGIVVLDRRPAGDTMAGAGGGGVLQVPLPPAASLQLARVPSGWLVQPVLDAPAAALLPKPAPGGIEFQMKKPGGVVTLQDPASGATLLVGTSVEPGPDSAAAEARRTPGFALVPTWLGIAVEAAADSTDLRSVRGGFLLAGASLPPAGPALALTRRFDLPGGDTAALNNRMRAQLQGAATALPRARARERLAAAGTMVSLGLAAEAQAIAQVAMADDPQAAADAGVQGLAAVAALLAGRPAEAGALDDKRLDGTDEIALWRGIRDRQMGRDTAAARGLGAMAPLALAYPPTLGRLVLPDVAEAAVETGAPFDEERLTPYAKAALLERRGKRAEALAAFEAIAKGVDRLGQVRGTARAAELRLALGQSSASDVAAVLERQAFAWRGDGREAGFRIRAAELRGQAGAWRESLEALRAIEAAFPEQKAAVRSRMAIVMQAMLAAEGGSLSALDVVLVAMEYADAAMDGEGGAALSRLLATKLSALDLPARAIPVLQGIMRGVPPGEARAALGARLAQVLLDGEEPGPALAALDGSGADGLQPALLETRALVRARAQAASGDVAQAAAGLAALGTRAADDLRATLLAKSGDWTGALGALASLAAKAVPPTGPLDVAAQDILMRQATAAAQAGDAGTMKVLAAASDRLTPPRDALFRVLTAAPVTGVADLARSARELRVARALPQPARAVAGR